MLIPLTIINWLQYNSETGIFIWTRCPGPSSPVGSVAGFLDKTTGYLHICFCNKDYKAHRLAWFFHYKTDPAELQVDHKNGVKTDNRIENLRLATYSQNISNSKLRVDSTSKVKGVSWHKKDCKWHARVTINGKSIHVGSFHSLEQAEAAIKLKRTELHKEFTNHG